MTVAAAASAAAPAELSSAPIEHVEAPPTPLSETLPAAAKVEAGETAKAAGEAKDLAKGADLERGKDGKFAPKEAVAKPADKAAPAVAVKPAADPAPKPGEQPAAAAKPAADPNAPKHAAPHRVVFFQVRDFEQHRCVGHGGPAVSAARQHAARWLRPQSCKGGYSSRQR